MRPSDKPKCGGKKRQPPYGPCTRPAGWGTNHPGTGRCKLHGGSTQSHNEAAQVEQARRDVELFGAAKDVHPAQALLELVQWTAGEVDYWRARVREIEVADLTWGTTKVKEGGDDRGTTQEAKPAVEYVMLVDASNRLEKYASAALRAGVDAALVRIAESQGSRLFDAIEQILAALGLTDQQRALVPTVVPPILRAIGEAS
jgi:hypothetical protein